MDLIENIRQYENEESLENPYYLPLVQMIIERRLPGLQRDIMKLYYYFSKTEREIVEALHIPKTCIRYHLKSACHKVNVFYSLYNSASIKDVRDYLRTNYFEDYDKLYAFYSKQKFFPGVRQLIDSMIVPFIDIFNLIYNTRRLYVTKGKYSKIRFYLFDKRRSYDWVEKDLKRTNKYFGGSSNKGT